MKILVFLLRWRGGVGRVIKELERELEQKGHELVAISREDDFNLFSSVKNLLLMRQKYKEIIEKENPDIIYTQDWSMALPLLFPFKIYKKKHYCCFHGNQIGSLSFMQPLIGRVMGKRIIAVGTYNYNRLPKSHLIPNGVNMERFKPLNKNRKFMGWINTETEVFSKKEIECFAKKAGYELIIARRILPERMNEDFYNKCDVFFSIPPQSAGCQLSWMEAMSAGVPKIIGNKEGDGDLLSISQLSDFKNPIDAIRNAKRKDHRKEMEEMNQTWERHTDKLLRVLKEEVDGSINEK